MLLPNIQSWNQNIQRKFSIPEYLSHSNSIFIELSIALLSISFILVVNFLLKPIKELVLSPYLLSILPVVFSSWYSGFRAGFIAAFLSALTTVYFFINPKLALSNISSDHVFVGLLIFTEGIIINILINLQQKWLHAADDEASRLSEEIKIYKTVDEEAEKNLDLWREDKEKLEALNKKITNILESITDAFFALDNDGKFVYYNKQAENLLEIGRQNIIGKSVWDEFPEIIDSEFYQKYFRAVATKEPIIFEKYYSPLKKYFEIHAYPSSEGLSVYFNDITRRKKIEDKLRISINEQKQLDRVKDEFIGTASHELKTPVTTIKAFTQLLQKILSKNDNPSVILYLNKMAFQVNRLKGLINDLMDVSKMQSGKIEYIYKNFEVNELVKETTEDIQAATSTHKIIIEGKAGCMFYGDRYRIRQVLNNIITNAIKYSPKADKIIIKESCNQDEITIEVKDFGIGIPAQETKKIFGKFYRIPNKGERFEGMGLGLHISSEIIKHHKGKILVKSKEGAGSKFVITLPAKSKELKIKNPDNKYGNEYRKTYLNN
ncbi:MAG: PAS domain-containing protein [Candidatus Roizmanbacteria bacterium]|nr:MAG: PAS domain-containing protein [Candidatus Roizmanbacteria bacterium]